MLVRWQDCLSQLVAYKKNFFLFIIIQRSKIISAPLDCLFLTISIVILIFFYFNTLSLAFNKIDLNSAGIKELESIPGIGKVLAKRIVEYRKKYGLFKSLEELVRVKGIGSKKLNILKKYLKIKAQNLERNFEKTSVKRFTIYYYTDENGIVHYSQSLYNIPLKYRSSVKILNY